MYHRVADVYSDPQMLCVRPNVFDEQINFLKKNYKVISLSSIHKHLNNKIPRKSVAITFDDGYQDNFINALPILQSHDIPATFFITSGYIGDNKEFYQEVLNRIFFLEKNIPKTLDIEINKTYYQYAELDQESQRKTAYADIHKALRSEKDETRKNIIQQLIKWSKVNKTPLNDYKNLTISELQKIAKSSLFEIGAHSVNHLILSGLDNDEQKSEIVDSKVELEKIIDKKITTFAYPYGTINSYNKQSVEILKENNFKIGCSNYQGLVYQNTSKYELPRMLVRDITIEKFRLFIKNNFLNY